MSDMILGAIIGALLICATLSAAHKLGLIQINFGREREREVVLAVEPRRVSPRIGCNITVEPKNDSGAGLTPQVRLFATIENEGEIVIRSLRGFWKVVTPDRYKHPPIKIQRDVLALHDRYLESYLLDEGIDMQGEGVRFDVEVEFDYGTQNDDETRRYTGKYRYDRKYHRMVKL
jgi:hypothetical protein